LWPIDPKFTIGSLLWLFWTLEKTQVCESKMLFEHPSCNAFFARLLQAKSCCTCKLKTLSRAISDALPSHGVKLTWGFHKVKLRKVETWRHAPGFQL
jgi:hypothetical protein